ncbi:MAG: hypothetical protein J3K34DRAFT_402783 [Monoraphidium minutum]|nr:MAG: hypothetical protein J3K34DRAFT_402783 [Monoraphidium minutum]
MDADAEEDAAARGGAAAGGDAAVAEAREAKGQLGQQRRRRPGRQPARRYAILGDLNTMANGVARLSPHYCCDDLRWRTLGMSEARYWQRHVFSFAGTDPSLVNAHFLALGLPRDVCRALVNPGFFDPFDPERDITLDNPAYRLGPLSLMTGKLDWALLKGLAPLSWRMANADWAASDHRALIVEAE